MPDEPSATGCRRYEITGPGGDAAGFPMNHRADPMLTYAMTALAANKQARLMGLRATFGRVEVEPSTLGAIPARVTAWLELNARTPEEVAALATAVEQQARGRAEQDNTTLVITAE